MAGGVIGRDKELSALVGVVDAALRGTLRVVIVEAAAGLGVTTLLDTVVDAVPDAASVRRVAADELEQARPLHPFARAHGGEVRPGGPNADDVVDELETAALRGGAVLVVEDLHWSDTATVHLLEDVVERLADLPVAVILSIRPSPPPPVAEVCERLVAAGATFLELAPLAPADVDALAQSLLGARCGDGLRTALAAAEGNVAAVVELLAALDAEGRLVRGDGCIDVDGDALPDGLRQAALQRLRRLPAATLSSLQVASVLGMTFPIVDLAALLGRPGDDLAELDAAVDAGFVCATDGGELAFRSALLREALYVDLGAPLRGALHAEAALVLDRGASPVERVAAHLLRSGIDHGPELVALLLRSAVALREHAPALALAVAERGLSSTSPGDVAVEELRAATVWPLLALGRGTEAEVTATELLSRPQPAEREADLLLAMAVSLQRRGQLAVGHDRLEVLLRRDDLPDTVRALVASRLPLARLAVGDLEGAALLAEDLVASAGARGDELSTALGLVPLALVTAARGDVPRATELADRVAVLADDLPVSVDGVALTLPMVLVEADRFDEARKAVRRVAQRDEETGDRSMAAVCHFAQVIIDGLAGAWDDAATAAEAGLGMARRGTGSTVAALFAYAFLARLALHRDDLAGASGWIEQGEAVLDAGGPQHGVDFLLWAKALLLEATEGPAPALELLALEWDLLASARYLLSWRSVAPDLVRLALEAGDRDRATAVTEAAEIGAARSGGVASAEGAARRCRAMLDGDAGAALEAVGLYRSSSRLPDAARCAEEAARLLARAGRKDDAATLFREALLTFDQLGATRDVNRVVAGLRAIGVATATGSRRPARPVSGWASLTAKEQEVAALVAEGLTNPEIGERLYVSRYTVETHLKHVFAKLGLSSRVELAAAAVRRT